MRTDPHACLYTRSGRQNYLSWHYVDAGWEERATEPADQKRRTYLRRTRGSTKRMEKNPFLYPHTERLKTSFTCGTPVLRLQPSVREVYIDICILRADTRGGREGGREEYMHFWMVEEYLSREYLGLLGVSVMTAMRDGEGKKTDAEEEREKTDPSEVPRLSPSLQCSQETCRCCRERRRI